MSSIRKMGAFLMRETQESNALQALILLLSTGMTILPLSTAKNFIRPLPRMMPIFPSVIFVMNGQMDAGKTMNRPMERGKVYVRLKRFYKSFMVWGDLTLCVAWNKLYKRIIFTGNPPLFFPKGRYYEDEFLNYKLLNRASRISVIPDALYFYFQRDNSIIHQYTDKHFTDLCCCIEDSLTWYPDDEEKRQWKLRHSLKLCFTLYKKCHDDLHFRNRTSEVKGLVFRIMKELKITYLTKRELVKVFLILVGGYGALYQVKCRLKASL